jgi:tetratricopeptide (TPR) repeat protein
MLKKQLLAIVLVFCCVCSFAQKRKKTAQQEIIVIPHKALTSEDSSLVNNLYYSGLKEKLVDNKVLALDYFKKILSIDPANQYAAYELAQLYFFAKDYENAKFYIEKATTIESNNEWYWRLATNIYQEQKDYSLMNFALDELIKIDPNKEDYKLNKANTLIILKRADEALAVYKNIEEQFGSSEELLESKQRLYQITGDKSNAIADIKSLIEKDSSNVKYYLYLGDIYYNNKQKDEAFEAYSKAKKLSPDNPFLNLAIADIYKSNGKDEEAFNELKIAFENKDLIIDQKVKVVINYFSDFPDLKSVRYAESLSKILTEVHADDPKSFSLYGDVLFQKNQLPEAKIAYEKAIALNKQVYAVWDQLIRINLALNDMESVLKHSNEALSYFPNQALLYVYSAMAAQQLKRNDEALSFLNNALNFELDKPLKIQVYSSLGDVYQALKRYADSDNSYEKALALDADNVYTLNNYAYYLSLRSVQLDKAEKMSLRSNELNPRNASFLDTYAWILFKQKKYKEAKLWMDKAIEASETKSATLYEHYGDIIFHLGDKDLAVTNWKEALKLDENNLILQRKINEKKYFE